MANKEIIKTLVSKEALQSLDKLELKLKAQKQALGKVLEQVASLDKQLSHYAQSNQQLIKTIGDYEKMERSTLQLLQEKNHTLSQIHSLTQQVIGSQNQHSQSLAELNVVQGQHLQNTAELLQAVERTVQQTQDYSASIGTLSQQIDHIAALQEALNQKLQQGAMQTEVYEKAMQGLCTKQAEYQNLLEELKQTFEGVNELQNGAWDPSTQGTTSLIQQLEELHDTLQQESQILELIRQQQAELEVAYLESEGTLQDYATRKQELEELEQLYAASLTTATHELLDHIDTMQNQSNSLEELTKKQELLQSSIQAMGQAEGQQIQLKHELEEALGKVTQEMGDLQKATEKATQASGLSKALFGELESTVSSLHPAFAGAITKVKDITAAAKAFIATPMGAVITAVSLALSGLQSWLTQTEQGHKVLNIAVKLFTQVIENATERAVKAGEWILNAFTSPRQAVSELGEIIQNNLIKRFEAFSKIGHSLTKIFSEDWKAGFKDLGNAALQAFTGVEEIIDKTANGFSKATTQVNKLQALQNSLKSTEQEKRDLEVETSRQLAEQNRLRGIASDQSLTQQQRQQAEKDFRESQAQLTQKDLALQKKTLDLKKEICALSGNQEKDLKEIHQLEIKYNQTLAKAQSQQSQSIGAVSQARSQDSDQAQKNAEKESQATAQLEAFRISRRIEANQQIATDNERSFQERQEALEAALQEEIQLIQLSQEQQLQEKELSEAQKTLINEKALAETQKLQGQYAQQQQQLQEQQIQENQKQAIQQIEDLKANLQMQNQERQAAMQQALVQAAQEYQQDMEKHAHNEKKKEEITRQYQQTKRDIIMAYNQELYEEEVKLLEESLSATHLSEEKKLEIQKQIKDLKLQHDKEAAEEQIRLAEEAALNTIDIEEELNKILSDKRVKSLRQMWSMAMDLMNSYYEDQLKKIDELEEREKEYDEEKLENIQQNLEAGLISQEEADLQKQIIEQEQAEREAEYERQRREIKKKQAIWEKANSISEAIMNTAVAVTAAYKAGPIIGPILAGIIAGMGAAQIAAIVAQPIPAYKKGGTHPQDGLALVGDGGRSEMVILPGGGIWKTPATDTLTFLPKGAEILPDFNQALLHMAQPVMGVYDDKKAEMVFLKDEVLRKNTRMTNDQLTKINSGIQSIRANTVFNGNRNRATNKFNFKKS